ncbi:toll/interleukin-1 receptor domain-containing protein [Caballeronia mineralivorans]|jgi:hypothetical protein|uniref:toll/interleukin-1 receptor domain-containing protein n=1 Tax=Caballeronia mineralivorans TaxID=2010198 RepID=UPI0023F09C4A|nr:toll/interleukin-1 receptor domain-containing protein [Caballeronia mineralivorans]MDB5781873.1 toll/interleukin receptor protein [Caballeronia mineralivorans]
MQSAQNAPKVFVSHASEDKERFVLPFATALRERGIDAWVDKWEMLPGDSLVDKIFEEGLKEASAVIVVISPTSVLKPWVREELNAAVVKRIEKGSKVIPVVLDSAEVPESLRSLIWEPVKDVSDFGHALDRIVDAIYGHTKKPALGPAPAYVATSTLPAINGLSDADSFVLRALFDNYMQGGPVFVNPIALVEAATKEGISSELVSDSLEVLGHYGHIELIKHLGPGPYHSRIREHGISTVLGNDEAPLIRAVALCLLNDAMKLAAEIAIKLTISEYLVIHAFNRLESGGHLKAVKSLNGMAQVYSISPTLRRALS